MKVLYINGEWDTSTVRIIEDKIGIKNFSNKVIEAGGYLEIDDDDLHIYGDAKIIEFGDIDKSFIDFIRNYFWDEYRAYDKEWFIIEE